MSICNEAIDHATSIGADECESVLCTKKIITVRITDSEIAEIKENHQRTIGIRLVTNKKIATIQSTSLEPRKLVEQALKSTYNLTGRDFWRSFPVQTKTATIDKTNDQRIWEISSTEATEIAQTMIDSAKHKKITQISGSLNIVCDDFEIQNTSDLQKSERSTYIAGMINTDSEEMASVSGIGQASARMLSEFDAQKIGHDARDMCVASANPEKCDSQTTSIIFDPLAVGELLFFVFGPNFALKAYSEKRSCFSQKIGMRIASDEVNLSDEPHVPNGLGSKSFDDEGTPTRSRCYISNGIMLGTYSDCYNAFKEKTVSSANACRIGTPLGRSSEPVPIPAPHNLTLNPGTRNTDEMIRDTKNGIFVSRLWYTYPVNPIKGDFSCTARSGIWLIRNGQMQTSIKPIRIIHNLQVLLQNISVVGDDPKTVLPWAAMPVTAPTIRCDGITISPT